MTSISYVNNDSMVKQSPYKLAPQAAEIQNASVQPVSAHLTMPQSPNAVTSTTPLSSALPSPSLMQAPTQSTLSGAQDIFSIADAQLASQYEFLREEGYGNWGAVWECKRRSDSAKVAIKLVHRTKTSATAARVRALWSEFKILRQFKNEPHPNIVYFDEFIITPSYALIAMDWHPRLIPVELPEARGRRYFKQLLSAMHFLHKNGVTHNDIKPSNILLSDDDRPKLCDFGFAKKYDTSPEATVEAKEQPLKAPPFHSTCSYGTPEYLSPERAKSRLHDERLADIYSLGCTFYEVIVGRTPFEADSSEEFLTKDALEVYYERTLTRRFYGIVSISEDFGDLIKQMIEPDAAKRIESCRKAVKHPFFGDIRKSQRQSAVSSGKSTPLPSPMSPKIQSPSIAVNTDKALAVLTHDLATCERLSMTSASPMILQAKNVPAVGSQNKSSVVNTTRKSPASQRTPVKIYSTKDGIEQSEKVVSPSTRSSSLGADKENVSIGFTTPKTQRMARTFGTPRSVNDNRGSTNRNSVVSPKPIRGLAGPSPKRAVLPRSPATVKAAPETENALPLPAIPTDIPFTSNLVPCPSPLREHSQAEAAKKSTKLTSRLKEHTESHRSSVSSKSSAASAHPQMLSLRRAPSTKSDRAPTPVSIASRPTVRRTLTEEMQKSMPSTDMNADDEALHITLANKRASSTGRKSEGIRSRLRSLTDPTARQAAAAASTESPRPPTPKLTVTSPKKIQDENIHGAFEASVPAKVKMSEHSDEQEVIRPATPYLRADTPSMDFGGRASPSLDATGNFAYYEGGDGRPSMSSTRSGFTLRSLLRAMSPQPDILHLQPSRLSVDVGSRNAITATPKSSIAMKVKKFFSRAT